MSRKDAIAAAEALVETRFVEDLARRVRVKTESQVPGRLLRERWSPPRSALRLVERALERGALSVRGHDRVLRVAWTLADLAGRTVPVADDVAEALGLRLQRAAA